MAQASFNKMLEFNFKQKKKYELIIKPLNRLL